jgi:hypothetical protein
MKAGSFRASRLPDVHQVPAFYVYVINNLGAFGPNMVKVGMTRRLNPFERCTANCPTSASTTSTRVASSSTPRPPTCTNS